ncbi:DUF3274 domain-containing protein [Burkholderia thailandensis]|nr:DUF3274 domain-containing protein [Burkholderia thailandensis]MUV26612.1 DUF3274 domain-containing protein [Burkholderia thailandensis]
MHIGRLDPSETASLAVDHVAQVPGHADVAGLMRPDDVTKNVALGNQYVSESPVPSRRCE